jgi:hypothetical protein
MRFVVCCVFGIFLLPSSFLYAQALPVAPGLVISNGSLPWALDRFEGNAELVPIHHSTVEMNNHKGANIAGSLAGSFFYKPKMTTELDGLHARTVVHDGKASFYVHLEQDPDGEGNGQSSNTATWVLVRAMLTKDRRIFARVQFTQLTGNAKRNDGIVETITEILPNGWLKLTPRMPLDSGEYAVTPVFKVQNTFSSVVYDFTLDPNAPNAKDASMSN